MADNDSKRYYWLKLKKDFFKRHDIRIIEGMPNGKDYVLFYLKLMCEATSHNGELRFSEYIPYSEEMLATITNTNIDVVRQAIKIFVDLKMMEILDDGTIYLNEVEKLIGSETGQTIRKRKAMVVNSTKQLPTNYQENTLEIEIEKDIDKDIEIDKEKMNSYGEFGKVKLTDEQRSELDKRYGPEKALKMIEILDSYMASNKKTYTNCFATFKSWVEDAYEKRYKTTAEATPVYEDMPE